MKISTKLLYAPSLILYAMGPLIHDVLPNLSSIGLHGWGSIALLYLFGMVAIVPAFFVVKAFESRTIKIRPDSILRLMAGIGIFSIPYQFFWGDWAVFYISLVGSLYAFLLCMIVGRRDCLKPVTILRDRDTGNYYSIKGGNAHLLSQQDINQYVSGSPGKKIRSFEFSSNEISGFDSHSPVIPLSFGLSSNTNHDYNSGIIVNPSTGMPMIGGMSGLDIHGNSWGTNFNEPSSTYDPNRGY
ncbi:hypothetical protein HVX06_21655 (plasmid) [Enterobacter sp. RHB15-C17]|nr:hypothetical protein HVX06_21655 [Enterobacter sp. RHB15-C17]